MVIFVGKFARCFIVVCSEFNLEHRWVVISINVYGARIFFEKEVAIYSETVVFFCFCQKFSICNLPATSAYNRVEQICCTKSLVVVSNNNISILVERVFWSFYIVLATGKDRQDDDCELKESFHYGRFEISTDARNDEHLYWL